MSTALVNLNCTDCDLHQTRRNVVPGDGDITSPIMWIAEAPGCITGDSLIDTAFRNKSKYPNGIKIRELVGKSGIHVYSYDIETNQVVIDRVRKVWKVGRKKVYRVKYEWWYSSLAEHRYNSIMVTSNHLFLLKKYGRYRRNICINKQFDTRYVSIDQGLCIGVGLEPFNRIISNGYSVIHENGRAMRESRFLLEYKLGRNLNNTEQCHHKDENKLNDSWDNLELLGIEQHSRYHLTKHNPMSDPVAKKKHNEVMTSNAYRKDMSEKMRKTLRSNPKLLEQRKAQFKRVSMTSNQLKKKYKEPSFYFNFLLGRQKYFNWSNNGVEKRFRSKFPNETYPPNSNHRIVSVEYVGMRDVYDMEVENYNNFACNGIFIHNSKEDKEGKPFVKYAKAGKEFDWLLIRHGFQRPEQYVTNCIKCHPPGDRNPTPEQIHACSKWLETELAIVNPHIIVTIGYFSTNYFLPGSTLETVHGIPFEVGERIIIPVYHPAAGFHNSTTMLNVHLDFRTVAEIVKGNLPTRHVEDEYAGKEEYYVLDNEDM